MVMASQRDTSITSYFQPTGEATGKNRPTTSSTEMNSSKTSAKDPQPGQQNKGQGKRPLSASPPAPAVKRSHKNETTVEQRKHLAYNDLPSNWLQDLATPDAGSDDPSPKSLQLTYHKGDMFGAAPKNCLLIHACNTQGHWGAGIAKAFKTHYPKAYTAHNKFCAKQHSKTNPVPTGTAQLLAPVDGDPQHWIGCVFTSAKYGKAKDKPDAIVRNTVASTEMLLELVKMAGGGGDGVGEIRMCKINSGKFGVPWERTEEALQGIVLREGWAGKIEVWEPSEN